MVSHPAGRPTYSLNAYSLTQQPIRHLEVGKLRQNVVYGAIDKEQFKIKRYINYVL